MKLFRVGISTMTALMIVLSMQAQTAEDIINKHIDAIGGKDLLTKITSIYYEGTASAMGAEYTTKTTVLAGKGFKNETSVNGMNIIQCITDTSGWMINPMAGQTEPVVMPADVVKKGKSSLDIGGELLNYKNRGFSDSLMGREMFQGVNAYKIMLSQPDAEIVYFIDPTTYYLLKSDSKVTMGGQEMSSTTTYSNYKKTDFGFVVPFTMSVTNMGYDVAINYSKIEVNKDVDPTIFAMPK